MNNTLITQDRLDTFRRNAHLIPPGDIIEVGVYKGGSLKYLAELFPDRRIFGYDTFEGLPEKYHEKDEYHKPGEFSDTDLLSVGKFINSPNVRLQKGIFPECMGFTNCINKDYALAHIDTDFYLSVKACIRWLKPRMVKGGMMVFDDYDWPNCPGVKQALDESELSYCISADYQALVIL